MREKNEIRLEQLKETSRANRFDVRKYKNEFFTDCDVQYHQHLRLPLLSAIVDSIMAKQLQFAGESRRVQQEQRRLRSRIKAIAYDSLLLYIATKNVSETAGYDQFFPSFVSSRACHSQTCMLADALQSERVSVFFRDPANALYLRATNHAFEAPV